MIPLLTWNLRLSMLFSSPRVDAPSKRSVQVSPILEDRFSAGIADTTGYLFLQERLSPDHELALMLINTIRKVRSTSLGPADQQDLSSQSPHHILLALHTIVKMPSRDLSPAVTPLLTSKMLLKHKL